jgi:hypothetical protein
LPLSGISGFRQKFSKMRKISLIISVVVVLFGSVLYFSCAKDACNTVNCLNSGSCSGGSCSCPTGWMGTFCQTSAFSGTWSGTDACDTTQHFNFSIGIDPNSTDTTKFIIRNPHGFQTFVNGTRSGASTIKIVAQPCGAVNLSGTLTLSDNNNLTFAYTLTDTGGTHNSIQCSGKYSR